MEPSSSPAPQAPCRIAGPVIIVQNITIEVSVCLTIFLLLIQFPITVIRKRYSNNLFKVFAYGAYTATKLLIPYIFGLMFSSRHKADDRTTGINLAGFLLIAYMNGPSVLGPYDELRTESLTVKFLIYLTYFLLMVPFAGSLALLELLVLSLCFISKVVAWGNLKTIKLDGGKRLYIRCMSPFEYLINDVDNDLSEMSSSEVLSRCDYVVDPLSIQVMDNKVVDRGTTIKKIWHDEQMLSFLIGSNENRVSQVKNTCLSFSLMWLLLHRLSGLPSYESSHQKKAWTLVRHGLIDYKSNVTFPFGVIEIELAFLSDFLYGNHFELYLPGYMAYLINQFFFLGAISYNVLLAYSFRDPFGGIVILAVVIVVSLLLIAQAIVLGISRWAKMSLLCTCLNQTSKNRFVCRLFMKKVVKFLYTTHWEFLKPWQRKLGQYSLFKSYACRRNFVLKVSSQSFLAISGIQFLRPGRKESKCIALTDDIKNAVIESLKAHGRRLSNGINSLEAIILPEKTMRFALYYTDAEVILVWHIATSICEIDCDLTSVDRETDKFHVATSLSKYCAYLVAFAPNLLPGLPAITDNTCTKVIEDTYTLLKGCDPSKVYEKLMKRFEDHGEIEIEIEIEIDKRDILERGVLLGKLLLNRDLVVDKWKLLADVWAEMILYLAPNSSNEWAHAARLAAGGEFITHLWALLFHAGIVDRDCLRNKAKDPSTGAI